MVAAVRMRDKNGLVFAAQKNRRFGRDTAERFAFGVKQIPFARDVLRFWHKG